MSWRSERVLVCRIRVRPRAGIDGFAGIVGDRLKVRVRSAPVDGKANKNLVRFLARKFGVPVARVKLRSGHSGRNKLVEITEPGKIPDEIVTHIDSSAWE